MTFGGLGDALNNDVERILKREVGVDEGGDRWLLLRCGRHWRGGVIIVLVMGVVVLVAVLVVVVLKCFGVCRETLPEETRLGRGTVRGPLPFFSRLLLRHPSF